MESFLCMLVEWLGEQHDSIDSLDRILLSIRIDHFAAYFSPPLGHADSEVDIPKRNNGDDKGIVGVVFDEEIGDGKSEINEHRDDLERDLLQKCVYRVSFSQS